MPDLSAYLTALEPRVVGQPLQGVTLARPFFLRSVDPPLEAAIGRHVKRLRLLGKRIVFELEDDLYLVLHLMIAGRLRWRDPGTRPKSKVDQATFDFPEGTLLITEAGSRKQASLHVVRGAALVEHDPGGIDVLGADLPTFAEALRREIHTVKRTLTDPTVFSGIGNAYSDEILHAAKLSPLKLTDALSDREIRVLHEATIATLRTWMDRLTAEAREAFPEKVTAFRSDMAVHGRYGKPCPVCGTPVQRVVFARNEMNYCPTCQTGGKLLADRALSRLLAKDWPRTLEELEARRKSKVGG
ncbi:MAG TPA: DNA-formamidopyrimidine glycosylase family protein [Vicinamibacterales bacterium]|nr:DNA-formamidopyrimidine glycosylase family protein [Vicinamibacterales bacterium]